MVGVLWERVLHTDQSAAPHPQNLPTRDRYTKVLHFTKKLILHGPLTFVHKVASLFVFVL